MHAVTKEEPVNLGRHYEALWQAYVAQHLSQAKALDRLAAEERVGAETGDLAWLEADHEGDAESTLNDAMSCLFRHLVHLAEHAFSPQTGARLKIESDRFRVKFLPEGYSHQRYQRFKPASLWDALAAEYGGAKGVEARNAQAASGLVSFFGLSRKSEVVRRGAAVILNCRAWLDGYSSTPKLDYRCHEELTKGLQNLAAFLVWAGEEQDAASTVRLCQGWENDRQRVVVSRQKFNVSASIEMVTYNTRFEFRLAAPLAAKLQVFIATYAAQSLQERNW